MLNAKMLFWFIVLLVVPLSFTSYLIHDRSKDIEKLHIVNLSFKGAPVLSTNENTFKGQMDGIEQFNLVDKVTSMKKNADEIEKSIKEKTEGSTNAEVNEFKHAFSAYDDYMNNIYKQMQIGNFINTGELEKIEKIYDMNVVQAESLIPMDATTIMWYMLCYYLIVLLFTVLYYHPEGFIDVFLEIFLLGFIFKS